MGLVLNYYFYIELLLLQFVCLMYICFRYTPERITFARVLLLTTNAVLYIEIVKGSYLTKAIVPLTLAIFREIVYFFGVRPILDSMVNVDEIQQPLGFVYKLLEIVIVSAVLMTNHHHNS